MQHKVFLAAEGEVQQVGEHILKRVILEISWVAAKPEDECE